ncbi:MAG TPA: hypothetical protein DHM37_08850 [Candidatus Cloacimonas sp.]|jgi:hypothetical protein|nr:hypothetical protein [Candidatus Cloacimonas sp.]
MKKHIIIILLILFTISFIFADEIKKNTSVSNCNKIEHECTFFTSLGGSLLMNTGVFVDIGISSQFKDYYTRFEYCAGLVKGIEIQARMTHFYNKERKSLFSGLFIGYSQSKDMELYSSSKPRKYKDRFIYGIEIGYSPIRGLKCSFDIGNMPSVIDLNISYRFLNF